MRIFNKMFNYRQFEINTLEYENGLILLISSSFCYFVAILNYILGTYIYIVKDYNVVRNSLIWLIFGTFFISLIYIDYSNKLKKSLTTITSTIIVIYLVLIYYPIIGPTVWTYCFLIILVSLLRNENEELIFLSVTLFFLGVYIWVYKIGYILNEYYFVSQFIAFSLMLSTAGIIMLNNKRKNYKIISQFEKLNSTNEIFKRTNISLKNSIDDHLKTILLLDESEKKFKSIVNILPDIIFKIEKAGKFIECEGHETSWFIFSIDEIIGKNITDLLSGEIAQLALQKIDITLKTEKAQKIEFQLNDASIEAYFEARFVSADSNSCYCIIRDISEEKNSRKIIEYLSFHDQLTNLYNRRFFEDELLRLDNSENYPLSIVMIDINGLKLTNDAFGHLAGDNLLIKVANILMTECGFDNIVSRVGGDEFVILLPRTSEYKTKEISSRIYSAVSKEKINSMEISVSIGWDIKFSSDQCVKDVLKKAEEIMYRNKLIEYKSLRIKFIKNILETLNNNNEVEKIHSKNVIKISRLIGEAMGLDNMTIKEIESAGLMHDIGKISVSNSILNKKEKLSDFEYKKIKHHPESGYHLLKNVSAYASIAEYVLYHHERWDGTGYPRGLKGEEIPLISRILAVAESFEAMTSLRPYRLMLSNQDALKELKDNSGTQFDENIIKVFEEKVFKKLNG